MTVAAELESFVVKRFLKDQPPPGFDTKSDLIGGGILNSLALVELLSHIERLYGIEIGESEIVPENFENIEALQRLVVSRMASTEGGR